MHSSDDRIAQLSVEWGAGLLTDAEYQAKYEALNAKRLRHRPPEATRVGESLAASERPRRSNTRTHEKLFGDGRPRALDRNVKARITHLARALMRRTERGKHYGQISAKAFAVLQALLWQFHNAKSGLCFPSYETLASAAGCARSTVAEAIKALEDAGLLTWVNRLKRVREWRQGLGMRVKVVRTSNGYRFEDPGKSSKSEIQRGTKTQAFVPLSFLPLQPSPTTQRGFSRKETQDSDQLM
jgi:AraC-like DNA-binding protein